MQEAIAQATHVSALIYYRKTLFGLKPKLTAVQKHGATAMCS